MPLILGANSVSGGYEIDNSLRFNSGSSDYLNRTPATTTNRRTWTWSGWVKRSTISGTQVLFGHNNYPTLQTSIRFTTDNTFSLAGTGFTGPDESVTSSQVFRDLSAWYHLVVAVDTTQATDSNRVKLYSNGVQITSFTYNAYPTQNLDTAFNYNAAINYIGATNTPTANANLYMAEVNFIDGQQLTPSSFGETYSTTGIWIPKAYTGSYGTNGFYLNFANSADLGNDVSGNNNDFTVNNLTSIDQTTDTPSNNFCTLNTLYNFYSANTYSEGNLKIAGGGGWSGALGTIAVSQGKWYWEVKLTGTMTNHFIGVQEINLDTSLINPMNRTGTTAFYNNDGGRVYVNGTQSASSYGEFSSGDIMGIALDMDAGSYGQINIYKNGSAIVSNFNLASTSDTVLPFSALLSSTNEYNFGNPPFTISSGNADANGLGNFEYAVPSGYYSLCTKNLAEYG